MEVDTETYLKTLGALRAGILTWNGTVTQLLALDKEVDKLAAMVPQAIWDDVNEQTREIGRKARAAKTD